ncbi:MAG: COR domain-containing protein, partial [Methanosarcina sp.]|nr:COR domain-containing protein [Methanosarcina sp.]
KISFNQLTSLPPEIAELKNLTELFLDGNPLENLPLEIMEKGIEEIRNYFKSFEEEKRPLNEVKVLLVGEGSSGKTSLVKRLLGEGFDGNEHQTQGINIKGWKFKYKDKEIKVNFWDFGGQEIMHSTHQFFLSKRSLYILVLDGRKDEKPEYWLKLIENFGGDSPVLVVINKIDENPAFELNRKFLHEKYPSIKGFYRLSCKSNEGVEEFSKALQEELTKVKHLETTWPKSWFNVKSRIEKICPSCPSNIEDKNACEYFNFIDYKEYKQMCENEGIKDESKQNTLVDFLHDLGVIIHFRDIPLLNTHVLEPEWVTNAVYKIVNSKDIVESRGVLKLNMLPEILKQRNEGDFYYPPDQYGFIISLMKKFELSYDLDDHTMLLPSLLEIQEPNFEFEYEGVLRFIIDYDFLPPIVMPRFIVKMSKDIKDDLRWRTGVILEDKNLNSSAVVRADNEAKRISIYVNGKQRRDYFAIILKKFREINNSFEKLKATEKIPLPDKPDVTVSYKHLIKLELRGFEEYMPDGSDKEYRVSDLLGTVINRNSERALLEEVHQMMELSLSNEKEILEVLSFLKENATESDTEETLIEKLNKYFEIRPQIIPGVQLNVNEIVKLFLKWRKGKF